MRFETPKIIRRKCFHDKRGYLQEIYLKKKEKKIFKFSLITNSKKHVFRGFHFQLRNQQIKLVYLIKGNILDYIIDLRKKSKNFGKVYKFKLKEKDILYIPKGFAHGYLSLASENIVLYYMTNYRDPKNESGIIWNDKMLKIKFPTKKIILSNKDKRLPSFKDFIKSKKSL